MKRRKPPAISVSDLTPRKRRRRIVESVLVAIGCIVLGDSLITHMINGDTVLQYSKPTMGGGVVNGYDSTLWQDGKALTSGFIALQSEGQPIDFRKVELLNLEK